MGTQIEDRVAYGDARECIRAAKTGIRRVNQLLAYPDSESAEESAAIFREMEVQLGCAAAILRSSRSKPDVELRAEVEELQDQVAILARFLMEADKLLSGWLRAVRAKRGGYTDRGQAAPLVLMNKLTVEG